MPLRMHQSPQTQIPLSNQKSKLFRLRIFHAILSDFACACDGTALHLWRESQSNALETLLNEFPAEHNPVIHSFLFNLLLTEADAPVEDQRTHAFLKARIRKLIDLGAVDAAHAMLERAAPLPPSLVPLCLNCRFMMPRLNRPVILCWRWVQIIRCGCTHLLFGAAWGLVDRHACFGRNRGAG